MTGVLLLELGGSLLLQPVIKISPQRKMLAQRRKGKPKKNLCAFAPLRESCFIFGCHPQLRIFHFVPEAAVHRGRDTHLLPTCPDRQAGTAQNRRDEKDYLSTRLAYRRLDIS
jgi:hypothetical protein